MILTPLISSYWVRTGHSVPAVSTYLAPGRNPYPRLGYVITGVGYSSLERAEGGKGSPIAARRSDGSSFTLHVAAGGGAAPRPIDTVQVSYWSGGTPDRDRTPRSGAELSGSLASELEFHAGVILARRARGRLDLATNCDHRETDGAARSANETV